MFKINVRYLMAWHFAGVHTSTCTHNTWFHNQKSYKWIRYTYRYKLTINSDFKVIKFYGLICIQKVCCVQDFHACRMHCNIRIFISIICHELYSFKFPIGLQKLLNLKYWKCCNKKKTCHRLRIFFKVIYWYIY